MVFAALLVAGVALSAWLWATQQVLIARAVNGTFLLLVAAWLGHGLWTWREHPIVRRIGLVVVGTVTAAILINIFLAFSLDRWMRAVVGVWAMSIGFYLALQAARWLLGLGHPVLGVARTLLDEALSMKAAVVLLVVLFVIVPFIPMMLEGEDRLSYRLQSFLTYSMIGVTAVLSLLTIVIAVTTITREVDERQIFLTMVKPVGRGQYVLGKWLGLAVLNLLLVSVSGVGIYTYARFVANQPAMNMEDVVEAHEQVLTARRLINPKPSDPELLNDMFDQKLATLRAQQPEIYGEPGSPTDGLNPGIRSAVQQQVITAWYALRPQSTQTYVFSGLLPAKQQALTVQLRMKPKAAGTPNEDVVYLAIRFNAYDDAVAFRKMADGKFHVVDVPVELIDDNGNLTVEVYNPPRPDGTPTPTVNFSGSDGISMFYRVSSFEANVTSAMALLWLRLCFLSMLALAAGTFLGFHVAALFATLICVAASTSGFLHESVGEYGAFPAPALSLWDKLMFYPSTIYRHAIEGEGWKAFQVFVSMIGGGFLKMVPDFSKYSGTESLAYGLYLSPSDLGKALLQVGLLWTGVTGVIAWIIFRRRELARVQV